eukprot:14122009-Alexandrium_andersonii.AAC.1
MATELPPADAVGTQPAPAHPRHIDTDRTPPASPRHATADHDVVAPADAPADDNPGLGSDVARFSRRVHPDSIPSWGPGFAFTWRPGRGSSCGTWQATCPYHRLTEVTNCTKSLAVPTRADKQDVL